VGVSADVTLRPGRTPLSDWRAIHDGATVGLDPFARVDVEAGRAALAKILSQNGLLPPLDLAGNSPSVAELIEARGEILPDADLKLFAALKLAALAQGISGMRWEVVEALAELLSRNFLPVVPVAADDRLALSHLFAALTGTGEILYRGRIRPATDMLRDAEMRPLSLNPRERGAILSGTELTLAITLGALFTAEHVFQSAIVAAALSALATGHPDLALHPSVHRLHRQRGQLDVATALHALTPHTDTEEASTPTDSANGSHAAIFRTGAALDLLRQAAVLLERAANGVSEDRLVLWQSEAMVPGAMDTTSLALAADLMAMSLGTTAALAAERIEAASKEDASESAAAKAISLAEQIRERGGAPAPDPSAIPRLGALVEATSEIVAIEFLGVARSGAAPEGPLSEVMDRVRDATPKGARADALSDTDVNAIAERVRSGALTAALDVPLPSVTPVPVRVPR
jgi:histidine ammonia-lyase